jgi:N-acetylglucosamine-6-phosphate deacetylase
MKTIDIHTHGIGGYDTRTTDVEHIFTIAKIHGSYGVSEIIPTIYPATIKIMRENMDIIKRAMELQKSAPLEKTFLTGSEASPVRKNLSNGVSSQQSKIIGVHLEGPFLNPLKCGALNAMTFIEPSEHNLKELIEGFEDIVRIITIAPELNGAANLIKYIADSGIVVSMGHSNATYAEAEAGFNAGAKGITHIFNAMRSFHHREPGIAGFGLINNDIFIEVIADSHHLHIKTLELIFKIKNHDKILLVSDSVKQTSAFFIRDGIVDTQGRLLGGSMPVAESAKMLIAKGFDEEMIMKCITENPERYLIQ